MAVHIRDELLGDHRLQGHGELDRDLLLLIGREHVDDPVRWCWAAPMVCRVEKTRWPVSAAVMAICMVS